MNLNFTFQQLLIAFYVSVVLIIFITVDIIYVSYCFARKKFPFVWPLVFLRDVTAYFVTVMFLPITSIHLKF